MIPVNKLMLFLKNAKYRDSVLLNHGFYNFASDKQYVSKRYYANFGKKIDWNNPITYNEKLQWLKLYDRKPEYVNWVDKYAVKEYVANRIGNEYVIPTLGVWDSFDQIDFSDLPSRFVLKCTHDSGGVVICKDKSTFDPQKAALVIQKSMRRDYYKQWREWPYKGVPRRIICEPYLEDMRTGELRDYKFFTFDGKVKALFVASDRQNPYEDTKFDFFDENYQHLNIINGYPNAKSIPEKPRNFELMKELASELSKGTVHVRVDFYEVNEKVFFGELTLYHFSGMVPFVPDEWDYTFGNWLRLPNEK